MGTLVCKNCRRLHTVHLGYKGGINCFCGVKMIYSPLLNDWIQTLEKKDILERKKSNKDKLKMSLVEPEFIEEIAKVLTDASKKYDDDSWKNVEDAEKKYKDALLRHTMQYLKGIETDNESGLPHLSHMATNIMFLAYFSRKDK
jgi:hypothetical protein